MGKRWYEREWLWETALVASLIVCPWFISFLAAKLAKPTPPLSWLAAFHEPFLLYLKNLCVGLYDLARLTAPFVLLAIYWRLGDIRNCLRDINKRLERNTPREED